jgi:hypothetical protein
MQEAQQTKWKTIVYLKLDVRMTKQKPKEQFVSDVGYVQVGKYLQIILGIIKFLVFIFYNS